MFAGYSLPPGYTVQNGCICAPGVCLSGNCAVGCANGQCAEAAPAVKGTGPICVDGKCYTPEQFEKKFGSAKPATITLHKDGDAWKDTSGNVWKK